MGAAVLERGLCGGVQLRVGVAALLQSVQHNFTDQIAGVPFTVGGQSIPGAFRRGSGVDDVRVYVQVFVENFQFLAGLSMRSKNRFFCSFLEMLRKIFTMR